MKKIKTLEEEINEFLEIWDFESLKSLLAFAIPMSLLYNVDDEDDWVIKEVGSDEASKIRLIRSVYMISRFAEFNAGKLAATNMKFRRLWEKMEKCTEDIVLEDLKP